MMGRVVPATGKITGRAHALLEEHVREEPDPIVLPPGTCRAQQPVCVPQAPARVAAST
jgi:hypothetical protein